MLLLSHNPILATSSLSLCSSFSTPTPKPPDGLALGAEPAQAFIASPILTSITIKLFRPVKLFHCTPPSCLATHHLLGYLQTPARHRRSTCLTVRRRWIRRRIPIVIREGALSWSCGSCPYPFVCLCLCHFSICFPTLVPFPPSLSTHRSLTIRLTLTWNVSHTGSHVYKPSALTR
ncbi:hypothetical protein EDB92DRAFT_1874090 [Lactarius akahatsu]|uniref:Uncharacterized protein n=1 Tax=Lactarius akahatsu TaxID=416441 RepID=A0AAD4LEH0_9AGAM|nr:hypothetical protein EDB92DRAFT_1874090 [Lactarius akahatsu]